MPRYRNVHRPEHLLAPPSGFLSEHRVVLFDSIGHGPHLCNWCGTVVHWGTTLLTDHVDEDKLNNDPANLVPACRSCNQWRNREKEGEAEYTCQHCGETFYRYKSQRRNTSVVYCSTPCYYATRYGWDSTHQSLNLTPAKEQS